MKLSLALVLILISIFPIHQSQSQQYEYVNPYFSPQMDMYSNNYLNGYSSGRGNTGIASLSGLSGTLLNPASLNLKKDYELNFQYTVKTIQPWNLISYSSDFAMRQNWFFSGYAGIAFKINKNLSAGISYSNPNSMLFYEGENTATYGDTYDSYSRIHVHSLRAPISFQSQKFSFGISLIYNIYVEDYHGLVSTISNPDGTQDVITTTYNRFNAQVGIIYRPLPSLSIGATFTPGFKGTISEPNNSGFVDPNFVTVARYPAKGGIGASFEIPDSKVKLYADYNFEDMKVIRGHKNRHNFNVGADYSLNKKITLRGGFFTLFNGAANTDGVQYVVPLSTYDQYFITAGATFFFKGSDLTVSFLDSHVGGGKISNTFLNMSYSAQF